MDRKVQGSRIYISSSLPEKVRGHCQQYGAKNFEFFKMPTSSETYLLIGDLSLIEKVINNESQQSTSSKPEVLIFDRLQKIDLIEFSKRAHLIGWIDSNVEPVLWTELDELILGFLERNQGRVQEVEAVKLVTQFNESMQRFSTELELRVEARRRELEDNAKKLNLGLARQEALHRCFQAIHLSQGMSELEKRVSLALQASADVVLVNWVKISPQSSVSLNQIEGSIPGVHSVAIEGWGTIRFGRDSGGSFRSEERQFLASLSEAMGLAIHRFQTNERMNRIKREWEEIFDSISTPIAVFNEQLKFVRGNSALVQSRSLEHLVSRNCYEAVFSRSSPCTFCPLYVGGTFKNKLSTEAQVFRVRQESPDQKLHHDRVYEVTVRPIDKGLSIHFYRDVTSEARFEQRISESSQMAELGTIGSSIAHQLNNPIGGMLSLIQLMLMDLPQLQTGAAERAEFETDLRAMESGAKRCAQIVRDLLGFTRRGIEDAPGRHDLFDIIEQAIKITELQTRTTSIHFRLIENPQEKEVTIVGRFNLLAQAIRAVLLGFVPTERGLVNQPIPVELIVEKSEVGPVLIVRGPREEPFPDLTIAIDLVREHGGILEFRRVQSGNRTLQEARFQFLWPNERTKI